MRAPLDCPAIYAEATAAAAKAVAENAHLENPRAFDCDFAWVQVMDGRSPFARYCRKMGHNRHWSKGVLLWSPGQHRGQSISVHIAGAVACADVLKAAGIEAYAGSRLD